MLDGYDVSFVDSNSSIGSFRAQIRNSFDNTSTGWSLKDAMTTNLNLKKECYEKSSILLQKAYWITMFLFFATVSAISVGIIVTSFISIFHNKQASFCS